MTANPKWQAADIGDLSGKIAVVTGANSGLGYETTRELLRHGAHCILASRSIDKAQAALGRLVKELPEASAEIIPLDLSSLDSVRVFSHNFSSRHDRLDLLINNAGIMMVPEGETEDGFESQLGTNHLGHFALTGLLLDALLATPGSRVVTLSSLAHRSATMHFENLMFQNGGYTPGAAYGRSKLANLLFSYELQRRLHAAGATTKSVAAHPGLVGTSLGDHLFDRWFMQPVKPLLYFVIQTPVQGVGPTLRAATDPDVTGGEYFGPGGFGEQRGEPVVVQSTTSARSKSDAQTLWELSIELTGVSFSQLGDATQS